jgi:hypothetical protein
MTKRSLDDDNPEPVEADWIGSGTAVKLMADLTSQSEDQSITFLMSNLRTGAIAAWCMSYYESKAIAGSALRNEFEQRATCSPSAPMAQI